MTTSSDQVVVVRDAIEEDVAEICQIGTRAFIQEFGHSAEPHDIQTYLEGAYSESAILSDLNDTNKHTLVATIGNTVIGFTMLNRSSSEPCIEHLSSTVELQRLYVSPDFQGIGAGKLLAQRLETIAKETGYNHIWLGVWEENHRACTVYKRLGFEKIGKHDFAVGSNIQSDWILFKEL
jgi:ribosomal protein S18 acetylase RimI-like enzyme